ncbi:MAG: alpha/beta fold hydrolase [Phycisphaerae bacterium]
MRSAVAGRARAGVVAVRCWALLFGMALSLPAGGCFDERAFPCRPGDVVPVDDPDRPLTPRQWLERTAVQLKPLLPRRDRPILLTDQMRRPDGSPIDVYAYFRRDPARLQGLVTNWYALQHTGQSIERGYAIENAPALWPGFESVWIPVAPGVRVHGFLGLAESGGRPVQAPCIVVLPGLFGDNGAKRSKDVSEALRAGGFHVLSLEPRGHGQTEARFPNVYYNYGVTETQDLMKVSEWLEDTYPPIRGTGLVGFCWGANQALLAAWYDGRRADDPSISPLLARVLGPPSPRKHFTAGVIAFSPVLRWEHFLDRMDTPKCVWADPSPAMFQDSIRDHMRRKDYPEISGNLRLSIAYDFAYSGLTRHFPLADGYAFLRLLPYRGQSAGDKLESARVPTLIVHAVNDPLQTAQEVADLIADTSNPNVAALILPGGGHIGFQAYARRHFYSLILGFFDPRRGAAATPDS